MKTKNDPASRGHELIEELNNTLNGEFDARDDYLGYDIGVLGLVIWYIRKRHFLPTAG
jgi:hypothetical protein